MLHVTSVFFISFNNASTTYIHIVVASRQYGSTWQNTLIGRRQSVAIYTNWEEPVCQQHATWSSGTATLM